MGAGQEPPVPTTDWTQLIGATRQDEHPALSVIHAFRCAGDPRMIIPRQVRPIRRPRNKVTAVLVKKYERLVSHFRQVDRQRWF